MILTILGSGVFIPSPYRGNSGYFLQSETRNTLIDGGSGSIRRFADFDLDYRSIDSICYSHMHPDHTFDLIPLLFAWKHDSRVEKPRTVEIICPKGFNAYYLRLMDIYGDSVIDEGIKLQFTEMDRGETFIDQMKVHCGRTIHTEHSITFRFEEEGRSLFYSGDTDLCEELVLSGKGAHTVILECSFPDDMKKTGHLTPKECGEIATRMGCQKLVLTHFFPEILETDIVSAVSKEYSGEILLANDGMRLVI